MNIRLDESIKKQEETAQILGAKILTGYLPLMGITVSNFPMFKHPDGTVGYTLPTEIAVENLRDKYNLHGEFTIEQLLEIEAQGGIQ